MVRITIAAALAFAALVMGQAIPNNAGARSVGNGQGEQFTTGGCVANADCQEGCCANNGQGVGICSGIGAEFQNGKQGCGFTDPNAQATIAKAKAQVQRQGF
ncbi:hypothetical protein MCOR27_006046 [Pyricularia oryzae]|uniref:Biotrophy-associated secreted protein 2 n=5 Tax=Pyricularia TaxID=48558 RepID=A0ABQ8N7F8_PYRGI|nr:uncharacterized protein MGG_07969 [Pyricularia oryzae 70-15]ELQ34080.1 hypothetical protein OOU_Y34scaffold00799g2 [Pyricularia oryzae Y34]KAH8848542.1 hypothetical protein MCOR01_001922 [Pyricularia oryzae]KAI6291693.1 hypothetical protein MCOR33_010415 [Pyricularia grisea]EHA53409.1 hypothetical protein MGG_07969 [Pyricularia oryzae 70-15]KAH9429506.1 hypothetical protein MCOR02_009244 [Pyricularia oryzae]